MFCNLNFASLTEALDSRLKPSNGQDKHLRVMKYVGLREIWPEVERFGKAKFLGDIYISVRERKGSEYSEKHSKV